MTPSSTPTHRTSWDLKVVNFVNQVLYHATDPTLAVPALLAGPLGPLAEFAAARGLLARGAATWLNRGLSLKYGPILAGLGAETIAFGLGSRSLNHLLQKPLPWDPASVLTDLALTGMSLTVLKAAGAAGREAILEARGLKKLPAQLWTRADHRAMLLTSQVSAYLGLVATQGVEAKLFPQFRHGSDNIWADALSTHLALGMGTLAGRKALGKNFEAFEQKIHDQLDRVYQQTKPQWSHFGTRQTVLAEGIAEDSNYHMVSKDSSAGRTTSVGKDDSGFHGEKISLPEKFKNGEPFHVTPGMGSLLEGMTFLKMPEDQVRAVEVRGELTPEDAIVKFVQSQMSQIRKPQQFIVYYGGKKAVDYNNILRQKFQTLFDKTFSVGFQIAVASPLAQPPMVYIYRKKSGGIETLRGGAIKTEEIPVPAATTTKLVSKPPEDSALLSPWTTPSNAGLSDSSSLRPTRKAENPNDYSTRNRSASTLPDLVENFQRILELATAHKEGLSSKNWRIELTQPFIELKPHELAELTKANVIDVEKSPERGAMQEGVFKQIQTKLMDELSEVLRKNPLPDGQVVKIQWTNPFTTTLTIQEKEGKILISIFSSTGLPKRDVSFERKDLRRGTSIDITQRMIPYWRPDYTTQVAQAKKEAALKATETPPIETTSTPLLETNPRERKLTWFKVTCEDRSKLLTSLGSALDSQKSFALPHPIHITLAAGRGDKPLAYEILNFLRGHPLKTDQQVFVTWDEVKTGIKAYRKGDDLRVDLYWRGSGGLDHTSITMDPFGKTSEGIGFTKGFNSVP